MTEEPNFLSVLYSPSEPGTLGRNNSRSPNSQGQEDKSKMTTKTDSTNQAPQNFSRTSQSLKTVLDLKDLHGEELLKVAHLTSRIKNVDQNDKALLDFWIQKTTKADATNVDLVSALISLYEAGAKSAKAEALHNIPWKMHETAAHLDSHFSAIGGTITSAVNNFLQTKEGLDEVVKRLLELKLELESLDPAKPSEMAKTLDTVVPGRQFRARLMGREATYDLNRQKITLNPGLNPSELQKIKAHNKKCEVQLVGTGHEYIMANSLAAYFLLEV
ncbi:hypothetical protein DMENIID0001_151600 [Sergentomyia squamirostris]